MNKLKQFPAVVGKVAILAGYFLLAAGLSGCEERPFNDGYIGYVEAEFVTVSTPAAGWVEGPQWQYGDAVVPGDMLIQFDTELQQLRLEEAGANVASLKAQFNDALHGARSEEIAVLQSRLDEQQFTIDEAKLELTRISTLREKALATQADYDKAVLNLKALEAAAQVTSHQIEVQMLAGRPDYLNSLQEKVSAAQSAEQQAEWSLSQRTLIARFSGSIKEIYTQAGEHAIAGQPLLLVQLNQTLKVRFYIPQHQVAQFQAGQKVVVTQDGAGQTYQAAVSYISQRAEFTPPMLYSEKAREDLVFLIEARFASPVSLHPGQPVSVALL